MLESLSQRIEDNIPHAVENPMPWPDLDYYWSSVVRDYPIIPEYEWIKKEYEKASVSFTYIELSRLSPAEFLLLQQQLNSVITSSIQKGGVSIPEEVIGFLKPGDKKNILIHEIEHLKELPKIVRSQAKVDIVIYKDLTDQVTIDGISVFNVSQVTDRDKALSYSAPQSLDKIDIEQAVFFAQRTNDLEFVRSIEQRIKERSSH